jgi:hypothetical protein
MGDPLGADLPGGERGDRDPLEVLGGALESMGFARMAPEELIREDELEVVPLLQLGLSTGVLDLAWLIRMGRAYAEGLRLAAKVENEAYRARFTAPVRASGADQRTVMELASQLASDFLPLVDRALMGIYAGSRRWCGPRT